MRHGTGAGDFEIAIEDRHGDFGFIVSLEAFQHVTQAGDVECFGRAFPRAQPAGFEYAVIEMIAVHWQYRRAAGYAFIEPGA